MQSQGIKKQQSALSHPDQPHSRGWGSQDGGQLDLLQGVIARLPNLHRPGPLAGLPKGVDGQSGAIGP